MRKHLLLFGCLIVAGCKPHDRSGAGSYDVIMSESWSSFTNQDYYGALQTFNEAKSKNPDASEPYSGTGWSYIELNRLSKAYDEFNVGSLKKDSIMTQI